MKKIDFKEIIILTIFNLILFQVPLMYYVSNIFTYIDEGLAVLAAFFILKSVKKHSFDKFSIKYLLILFVYVIFTGIANYTAGIVTEFSIISFGILLFLRNFIILIGIYNCDYNIKSEIIRLTPIFIKEIKILLLLALCFWPINLILKTGMTYDVRFGINSYSFIFHHPGNFATYMFFSIIMLTYFSDNTKFIFSNKTYIYIAIFLLFTSLRFSFIVALGVYAYFRIMSSNKINEKNKRIIKIVLPIVVTIAIMPQVAKYFLSGDTPRSLFYKYSFITFSNYPMGTGFSTYGSYMAQVNYSQLYNEYGFNILYGMSQSEPLFLFDNFWPMIIVESGIIGFICILFWFYLMYKEANEKNNIPVKIIILFLFAFCIIGQTLIHFSSVFFYLLMGLTLSTDDRMLNENNKEATQ